MQIIVVDGDDIEEQLRAAKLAINHGLGFRDVIGYRINGKFYGVYRNKNSVRVHPQSKMGTRVPRDETRR